MTLLGIDPGTTAIGYALIENGYRPRLRRAGLFPIGARAPEERLSELYRFLTAIIAEEKPDACAVEKLFFVKNIKTGMGVAEARGVILLTITLAGLKVFEYTPLEIKRLVTGDGNADKLQVRKMIHLAFPETKNERWKDDVFDAIAVALGCLLKEKFRS